jgi:hypothetical protein
VLAFLIPLAVIIYLPGSVQVIVTLVAQITYFLGKELDFAVPRELIISLWVNLQEFVILQVVAIFSWDLSPVAQILQETLTFSSDYGQAHRILQVAEMFSSGTSLEPVIQTEELTFP